MGGRAKDQAAANAKHSAAMKAWWASPAGLAQKEILIARVKAHPPARKYLPKRKERESEQSWRDAYPVSDAAWSRYLSE